MNAGVSISPCVSTSRARRAGPSAARSRKSVIPDVPKGTAIRNPFSFPVRGIGLVVERQRLDALAPFDDLHGLELGEARVGLAKREPRHVREVWEKNEVRGGERIAREEGAAQL